MQSGALIDCIVKGYVLTAHQTNDMQRVFRKLCSAFDKHKATKFKALLQWYDTLQSAVFWDVKACSLVEVQRRFAGTYCLSFRGLKVSQFCNQQEKSLLIAKFCGSKSPKYGDSYI
jgi:hypothetical protein